jgi:hypothetical protein
MPPIEDEIEALSNDEAALDEPEVDDDDEEASEYDEHDLSTLTEEERAALTGSDDGDDEPEVEEEAGAVQEEAEAGDKANPEAATPAAEAPAGAFPDTEGLTAARTAAEKALDAAFEKYEDGEMTREEYLAEQRRLSGEIGKADTALENAKTAETEFRKGWVQSVQTFATSHPEIMDEAHLTGFDAEVRAINANPAFDKLSHARKLDIALDRYRITAESLGNPLPAPAKKADPTPAPKKDPAAEAGLKDPRSAKPAKPDPVPTLARMPAAATTRAADGKWGSLQAAIDAETDPVKVEKLMAALSEDEREAFASADA